MSVPDVEVGHGDHRGGLPQAHAYGRGGQRGGPPARERTVRTNSDGHLELVAWSAQFDDVAFAVEDCRHLTRRLEADLLRAGVRVVRVPTRLMAEARRGSRTPGKSDPIDGEAVAIAALRTRTCRSRSLTGRPGRSSCCPITAKTWSGSGPGSPRRSAGTCTSWTRT